MKKILALVGSNSSVSINKKLAAYTLAQFPEAETELFDLQHVDIPIYNPDLQVAEGFPQAITELFEKIQNQDALIIASPEYNGSMPAALKNVVDWLSRVDMKFLGGKPVLLLSTSPGKNGGATNLGTMKTLLPWWGANVVASHSQGNFYQVYDQESQGLIGEAADTLKNLSQQLVVAMEEVTV